MAVPQAEQKPGPEIDSCGSKDQHSGTGARERIGRRINSAPGTRKKVILGYVIKNLDSCPPELHQGVVDAISTNGPGAGMKVLPVSSEMLQHTNLGTEFILFRFVFCGRGRCILFKVYLKLFYCYINMQ